MTNLPRSAPSSLLRAIFENVQCQSQLFPERQTIYLIFKNFIESKLDDLRSMGPDLVYGIISSIDGERDPKNLMLLFDILLQFIKEFPLGHLTEEMFEVLACYFPVDFNPVIINLFFLFHIRNSIPYSIYIFNFIYIYVHFVNIS